MKWTHFNLRYSYSFDICFTALEFSSKVYFWQKMYPFELKIDIVFSIIIFVFDKFRFFHSKNKKNSQDSEVFFESSSFGLFIYFFFISFHFHHFLKSGPSLNNDSFSYWKIKKTTISISTSMNITERVTLNYTFIRCLLVSKIYLTTTSITRNVICQKNSIYRDMKKKTHFSSYIVNEEKYTNCKVSWLNRKWTSKEQIQMVSIFQAIFLFFVENDISYFICCMFVGFRFNIKFGGKKASCIFGQTIVNEKNYTFFDAIAF